MAAPDGFDYYHLLSGPGHLRLKLRVGPFRRARPGHTQCPLQADTDNHYPPDQYPYPGPFYLHYKCSAPEDGFRGGFRLPCPWVLGGGFRFGDHQPRELAPQLICERTGRGQLYRAEKKREQVGVNRRIEDQWIEMPTILPSILYSIRSVSRRGAKGETRG